MRFVVKLSYRVWCILPFVLCILIIRFFELPASASSSLNLEWNQSQDTNAVGYKLYYGTSSHNYTNVIVAGNVTNLLVSGVVPGLTYYFAATAYTSSGAESDYSTEVSYTVPPGDMLNSAVYTANQFSFDVKGVAGLQYVVEGSTNLIDWIPLQTNTAPFTFKDENASHFGQRFYQALNFQ
jgi:hypothetical protein